MGVWLWAIWMEYVSIQAATGDGGTDVWSMIAPYIPSTGITAGGAFTTFFLLLARGVILTGRHHSEVVAAIKASNEETVRKLNESHAQVVSALREAHTESVASLQGQLAKVEVDRDFYRKATDMQRERADAIQSKVTDEVVPILGVTTGLLKGLGKLGGAE